MKILSLVSGVGLAVCFAACSGTIEENTTTSTSGTGGISLTGGANTSTGGTTSGPGTTTTTTNGGTGASTSGTTTTGTNTTSSGGSTTGSSTTSGSGSSGGTTTTSSSGGTTGYYPSGPYQGFDAGFPLEPAISPGCNAVQPFANPSGGYPQCVQCRTSADCPSALRCDSTSQCVACRSNSDCSSGEVCETSCQYINVPPYYVCNNGCRADCRTAGAGFCNPGLCDGDAGGCLQNQCTANSQCVINGQGACNFQQTSNDGLGTCASCTQDAGGCGKDEFCITQFGQNSCQLSCLVDAGVCAAGTYCSDAGICNSGCQTSNDCIGSSDGPICHQGACVGCLNSSSCPDYNAGCGSPFFGGPATCGLCGSQSDCPSNLHCENLGNNQGNSCGCHSDDECANYFLDAPTCIGLNAGAGFPEGSGRCGCTDSSQCPTGFVCESRYPFTVSVGNASGTFTGGVCITQCNLVGSSIDCATAGIGTPNPNIYYPNGPPPPANVCNSATGYCVSCAQDSECYSPPDSPASAPSCVQFPNGTDTTSGEPTGGGQCGCSDTSQCNDGYACWNPGLGGTCQAPCTIIDGQDSCNPYHPYYESPPTEPFCDTFTGACVACHDDWGCTNVQVSYVNGMYTYPGFAAPLCNSVGQCVGCASDSDCPSNAPNCTDGFCGYCTNNAQCYGDAGFTCVQFNGSGNGGECLVTSCVGDSNDIPTDAGTPCPSGTPYCAQTEVCSFNCTYISICASCRPDYYPPNDTYYGDCGRTGYCQQNGTCYYNN